MLLEATLRQPGYPRISYQTSVRAECLDAHAQNHCMQGLPAGVAMPPATAEALTLAHLLDQMWAQRPSRQMEASPWYERACHLVRSQLGRLTSAAAKVSPNHKPQRPIPQLSRHLITGLLA